jgi:DNA-binding XRE family transcriptional regulator
MPNKTFKKVLEWAKDNQVLLMNSYRYCNPKHFESMKNIRQLDNVLPRIAKIEDIIPFQITCLFTNGETRRIDFASLLEEWKANESTAKLLDFEQFKQVSISDSQTLQWENVLMSLPFLPEGLQSQPYDLDPDVLYQQSILVAGRKRKIGKLIKEAREKAGLTQEELAKKSGTSRYHISRIENGKSEIRTDTLEKIIEIGLGQSLRIG